MVLFYVWYFLGIFNVIDNIIKIYIFFCYNKEMEFSRVYSLMFVVIGFILVFFIIYMVYIYI